ncbi:hypothetical protein [Roseimaritima ulvae]|uniref:Uncharacterized protein n=1 Tax=Roseimaritima ulvae TaxID=980254 RepID=A0A5B9QRL0_9BACT|nr:hypothetical protein [Roseimaritima ulvae]QEG39975.1 hypothetical protein UC8_19780 [Roseimaritima ulvae]
MTAASIILALTLLGFAVWLELRERDEPQAGDADAAFDDDYLLARRRGRRAVHVLLVVAAVLILIAGLAGPGPIWIAMWLAVCGLLVVIMMLGMMDFYRSNRYLARKLPELRKQVLDASGEQSGGGTAGDEDPAS